MKKLISLLIIFSFINSFSQIGNKEIDSTILATEALKLFDKYSPKIEKSNSLTIQYRKAICGDLNNDNLTDVIVEFGLGVKNSNAVLLKEAAIYLNTNNKLKVISGFSPDYCFGITKIENGIVKIDEYEGCANFLKPVKIREYMFSNNKLVEKK